MKKNKDGEIKIERK